MLQGLGSHVAEVSSPAKHDVSPDASYPALHSGVHDFPLSSDVGQSPREPFSGSSVRVQGFGSHLAEVSTPFALHCAGTAVYPSLHTGVHDASAASESEQSPSPGFPLFAFAGAVDASHVIWTASHLAAVSTPSALHCAAYALYPALHTGVHDPGALSEAEQSPSPSAPLFAFTGAVDASHVIPAGVPASAYATRISPRKSSRFEPGR